MAWIKDSTSLYPKTVYTAPASVYPIVKVIYDPNATNRWAIEYAYLDNANETQLTIEGVMGL